MLSRIPSSVKTALLITLLVVLYFLLSALLRGSPVVAEGKIEEPLARVVTERVSSGVQNRTIEMRGRTKAKRMVTVRAETTGLIAATPATEGTFVKSGQILCQISAGTRNAALAEARAAKEKARIDYQAARELSAQGFSSDAAVASAKAAYDLSDANLKRVIDDFSKTYIKAPFDGVLQTRHVEVGDFLSTGAACATVAELNPIVISGAVSEQDIGALKTGARASVTVSSGEQLDAVVTLVSSTASNATRTFEIELTANNPAGLPDGLTANALIELGTANAHRVPRNSVVKNDDGITGVRVVDITDEVENVGEVQFFPVRILRDDSAGIWVSGLAAEVDLIVRGQNYVRHGQSVQTARPGETLPDDRNEVTG